MNRQLYKIDYFWQDDYVIVKNITKEQVQNAFCKTVKQRELQDDDDWTFFEKLENNVKELGWEIQFFLNTYENQLVNLKYCDNDNSEYSLKSYKK